MPKSNKRRWVVIVNDVAIGPFTLKKTAEESAKNAENKGWFAYITELLNITDVPKKGEPWPKRGW